MSAASQSFDPAAAQALRSAARSAAPDLYLAALLAPPAARDDLVTLAAFAGEIGRIALSVSEPTLGLIKLQWWRDALKGGAAGQLSGHPVADATSRLLSRHGTLRPLLEELIEAHDHLLTAGEISDAAELGAYLTCTSGAYFRAASDLIGVPGSDGLAAMIANAGTSYGSIRLAVDLPYFLVRALRPLPLAYFGGKDPRGMDAGGASEAVAAATRRLVEDANGALAQLRRDSLANPQSIAAILPVALVEPYSRALQRAGRRALSAPADISPARRAGRLWLASWRRRI